MAGGATENRSTNWPDLAVMKNSHEKEQMLDPAAGRGVCCWDVTTKLL
jgi:hypothetical protein